MTLLPLKANSKHLSHICRRKKNWGDFHYFYHCYPCRISPALGERSHLLCLVDQQNYELSCKWGLPAYPHWLCACALSYSSAILLQGRGCGGVQHGLGNLFMAGHDDWAKETMIWSPQVSSWVFSLGRGVWQVIFNMWIEQVYCWHWENGGGAPQWSFGNTTFKNSSNVWQFSLLGLALLASNWNDQVETEI